MSRKHKRRFFFLLLPLLLLIWGILLSIGDAHADKRLQVVASIYPLGEFARQVGGEFVDVKVITPPGAEPHEFEASPADLKRVWDSGVFLFNGAGLDPWAKKIEKDLSRRGVMTLDMAKHMDVLKSTGHDGSGTKATEMPDPHYWLDPLMAIKEVEAIRDAFIKADPAHTDRYRKNATTFIDKLKALDLAYQEGLKSCKRREFVVTHGAFNYLSNRYGLLPYAITGMSPEEEPTPKGLGELVNLMQKKKLEYVFFETLVSPRLARTLAKETGAKTLVLNPVEGLTQEEERAGKGYLSLMEENLKNLRLALECRQELPETGNK